MFSLSNFFRREGEPLPGSPDFNDSVRRTIAELGDSGVAPRHVLHYAYPNKGAEEAAVASMIAELTADGYEVSETEIDNGLVLEHHHSVAQDEFDPVTAQLSAWFAARNWDYDGWECAVQMDENAA